MTSKSPFRINFDTIRREACQGWRCSGELKAGPCNDLETPALTPGNHDGGNDNDIDGDDDNDHDDHEDDDENNDDDEAHSPPRHHLYPSPENYHSSASSIILPNILKLYFFT